MRKIFILDGYNVIYKIPEFTRKLKASLESARNALAIHVSGWIRKYPGAKAYIVFDGRDEISKEFDRSTRVVGGVTCVFTKSKESADERIVAIVRSSANPETITVISADNLVRNGSRAHRAYVEEPSILKIMPKKSVKQSVDRDKNLDSRKGHKITTYYEEYLEKKGVI